MLVGAAYDGTANADWDVDEPYSHSQSLQRSLGYGPPPLAQRAASAGPAAQPPILSEWAAALGPLYEQLQTIRLSQTAIQQNMDQSVGAHMRMIANAVHPAWGFTGPQAAASQSMYPAFMQPPASGTHTSTEGVSNTAFATQHAPSLAHGSTAPLANTPLATQPPSQGVALAPSTSGDLPGNVSVSTLSGHRTNKC